MVWLSIMALALDALVVYLRVRERFVKPRPVSAWVTVAEGVRVRAVG